ncbi:purine-nucleoside phosphorylase [candidate division NPL-UPA2 bacterium]|nr:purine-nucleoside phosphorylase [candidate division NPL-UPA2 bacterium]
MADLKGRIKEAVSFIKSRSKVRPRIAIILGTGLGALADEIEADETVPYSDIPSFPASTVIGHAGQLVLGKIGGKKVVAMQGRFHYYEGYSLEEVTFPVRVMRALGAETFIVSNAAGGMNPQFETGDLMIITDHINLMGVNPLIGVSDERLGPRFPDMSEPYDRKLVRLTEKVAREEKIKAQKGVYVAVTGPNLETAAEYRFLRLIGADAVGMSTVPEVIVAVQAGMRVLGISCITDKCLPDVLKPANIEAIFKVARTAEPKLTRLVSQVIGRM